MNNDLPRIEAVRTAAVDYSVCGIHADFTVEPDQLVPAARMLFESGWFLEDVTGVDVEEGIMLVYHFDRYEAAGRIALRLVVAHHPMKAPSIAGVISGADWHERECYDFYGVQFENHPNLKPLLLSDDIIIHPLIKQNGRRSLYSLMPLSQVVDSRVGASGGIWDEAPPVCGEDHGMTHSGRRRAE